MPPRPGSEHPPKGDELTYDEDGNAMPSLDELKKLNEPLKGDERSSDLPDPYGDHSND